MPHNYFFSSSPLKDTTELAHITGEEFHHATRVMRLQKGDELILIDGAGHRGEGHAVAIEKQKILVQLDSIALLPPSPSITLILGLQRLSHLEIALEKCTELGATTFKLFVGDKSERDSLTPTQSTRLEMITKAAVKQSGRLYLPKISFFSSLQEAIQDEIRGKTPLYFGDIETKERIKPSLQETAALVIGPESGFSQKELSLLRGCATPLSLHKNILRAETAAIVGCYYLFESLTAI